MALEDIRAHLVASDHNWTVEEIEGGLTIVNEDGVLAHLILTEHQMIIESLLFPVEAIEDVAKFDDLMMFAQKKLPLTSIGKTIVAKQKFYAAFGALSADSKLENVELEVVMLYQNITELLDFSADFLRVTTETN
ncbi:DUF2170 family protein [Vibrio sp. WXL210]|uniref:DUF2170 family protein n=1 Tax=Vibrio sp. WXL210 TaxID=3450709 RepID=UPI003EC91D71